MKKTAPLAVIIILLLIITGCTNLFDRNEIQKVGMLVEGTAEGNIWDEKGLKSLEKVKSDFGVKTFYQDEVNERQKIITAVDSFVNEGVNLIFGHGQFFGKTFLEIAELYPDVHFVYFDGKQFADNVTSIQFNTHALGFFAGMIAGEMTETNHIGVISTYDWQPEVEGFFEGANYQNDHLDIHVEYVNAWDESNEAIRLYDKISKKNIDIVYPIGDFFSEAIIDQAANDGIYAIGSIEDQLSLNQEAVLTSTVRDVEEAYELVTKKFNQKELNSGLITFDFEDKLVSLGMFNSDVPRDFQKEINNEINMYVKTGLLPYQR